MMVGSGEREECIAQLCEVVGLENDSARHLLEATGWRIEEAIAVHFAQGGDAVEDVTERASVAQATVSMPSSLGQDPARRSEPLISSTRPAVSDSSDDEEDAAVALAAPAESAGWFGSFGRALSGLGQSVLGVSSEDFDDWFLSRYGTPVPIFRKGSFGEAVKTAIDNGKLLLIWFHQDETQATDQMCMEILQNPSVIRLIRKSYILWAGDVSRFEPGQIARLLAATLFPTLVVCQPLRNGFEAQSFCLEWPLGTFAQPLFRLSPNQLGEALNADQAIVALTTASEDHNETTQVRAVQVANRSSELAEERRLREEQDLEFQESLLLDQMAEIQRQEMSAPSGGIGATSNGPGTAAGDDIPDASAIAAEAFVAQNECEEKETKRLARRAAILAQPEPDTKRADNAIIAKLSVRLPSGERLQRSFLAEQTLDEVYEWVHCCRPCAQPAQFELQASFPARALTERSSKLTALDLVPSAALLFKAVE